MSFFMEETLPQVLQRIEQKIPFDFLVPEDKLRVVISFAARNREDKFSIGNGYTNVQRKIKSS